MHIPEVKHFKHLGIMINEKTDRNIEINEHTHAGTRAYLKNHRLLKDKCIITQKFKTKTVQSSNKTSNYLERVFFLLKPLVERTQNDEENNKKHCGPKEIRRLRTQTA